MKIGNIDIPVNRNTMLWGGAGIAAIAAVLYIRSQTTNDATVGETGFVPGSLIFDTSGSLSPLVGIGSNTTEATDEQVIFDLLQEQLEVERDAQAASSASELFQEFLSRLSKGDFARAFSLWFKTPWGTDFEFNYNPVGQMPIDTITGGKSNNLTLSDFWSGSGAGNKTADNAANYGGLGYADPTFDNISSAVFNAMGVVTSPISFAAETLVGQVLDIPGIGMQDIGATPSAYKDAIASANSGNNAPRTRADASATASTNDVSAKALSDAVKAANASANGNRGNTAADRARSAASARKSGALGNPHTRDGSRGNASSGHGRAVGNDGRIAGGI